MKIYISKIPNNGLEFHEIYDPKDLDLEIGGVKFKIPVEVSTMVIKDNKNVEVNATIKWELLLTCSRCLNSYEVPMSKKLRLSYKITDESFLDISDDIRQEIILSYPIKPLCIEDCKGLCQICGKNLNEGDCDCATA